MIRNFPSKLSLLWIMRSSTNPDSGVKMHEHNYYSVVLIMRGSLRFQIGEGKQIVSRGDILLIPAEVKHAFHNETDKHAIIGEVKFTVVSKSLHAQLKTAPYFIGQDKFMKVCIEELLDVSADYADLEDEALTAYLNAMLVHILRKVSSESQENSGIIEVKNLTPLTKQIMAYLNENYSKPIRLENIAEHVGFNKNYMCGAFKTDTGTTIGSCLTAIRIRKAAELISYGECTLPEAAQQAGFTNLSNFNRVFSRYVGISPGQYRRAYPVDILLHPEEAHVELEGEPELSRFIFSVLARKKLTLEEIRKKDSEEANE